MEFYDLRVHTDEDVGEDSPDDVIDTAKKLGFSGISIVKNYKADIELNWPSDENLDIVKGVLLNPRNVDELTKNVNAIRNSVELVMVQGGDYDINRKACEMSMVDVLCSPEKGRNDSGLDHICVREAKRNNVAIEVNFRDILKNFKRYRVRLFSSLRKNIMLCRKYGASIVTTSSACSKWEMRNGRQIASIPHLLGMELNDSVNSITKTPQNIVKNNREKLEGNKWEGVSIE